MTDPWKIQNTTINTEEAAATDIVTQEETLEFEDNFAPNNSKEPLEDTPCNANEKSNSNCNKHQPLPDSASYLQSLERKLQKIQKGGKLIEALGEKRQQCLRTLLQEEEHQQPPCSNNNELLELDTPIANSESAVQGIYRHLQPVQALSIGEVVHIVKYDQLEEQKPEQLESDVDDANDTESSESR